MQCNIDRAGRRVRWIGGAICLAAAVPLIVGGLLSGPHAGYLCWGGGFLAGAAFLFYEARKGWCALRAAGIKTRF
jgi:hypothetical protein